MKNFAEKKWELCARGDYFIIACVTLKKLKTKIDCQCRKKTQNRNGLLRAYNVQECSENNYWRRPKLGQLRQTHSCVHCTCRPWGSGYQSLSLRAEFSVLLETGLELNCLYRAENFGPTLPPTGPVSAIWQNSIFSLITLFDMKTHSKCVWSPIWGGRNDGRKFNFGHWSTARRPI